jgi:Dyp-type peroxidase family
VFSTTKLTLNLDNIQGDAVVGLQKDVEYFIFFKIVAIGVFRNLLKRHLVRRLTSARLAHDRELVAARRQRLGLRASEMWLGVNLGFTNDGLTQLLGPRRPQFDPSFERGASHPDTIAILNDPAPSAWVSGFLSDRIDGVLLITGPDKAAIQSQYRQILAELGNSIKPIYAEIAARRPGAHRRKEHFGFTDGISLPGIRGLTPKGTPGRELAWPGEFVLGYPRQNRHDSEKPGPIAAMPVEWARDGSYLVFRRLEQGVPEFRRFVGVQAARQGINPELIASRMVGRWRSGAPLELAPRWDNPGLGADDARNNEFSYASDPFGEVCPFAAHIRRVNPRDAAETGQSESATPRIFRAGISFGPEVGPAETTTTQSRGLMFTCYQSSIEQQFELIQRRANSESILARNRLGGAAARSAGHDAVIGQGIRADMPQQAGLTTESALRNQWKTLEKQNQFVFLTAAGYFFMPSLSALRTALT